MKIIELHSDIFTDVAIRRAMGKQNVIERLHLPNLQKSGVAGIIGVFWVEPKYKNHKKKRFLKILKYVSDDLRECSKIKVITTPKDLLTEPSNRGVTTEDIEKVSFRNFYRFLTKIHQSK